MAVCYIGIGSNLGDRQAYIDRAIGQLNSNKDINITRSSKIYETGPVSDIPQGKFLNGVLGTLYKQLFPDGQVEEEAKK